MAGVKARQVLPDQNVQQMTGRRVPGRPGQQTLGRAALLTVRLEALEGRRGPWAELLE